MARPRISIAFWGQPEKARTDFHQHEKPKCPAVSRFIGLSDSFKALKAFTLPLARANWPPST